MECSAKVRGDSFFPLLTSKVSSMAMKERAHNKRCSQGEKLKSYHTRPSGTLSGRLRTAFPFNQKKL